MICPKCGTTHNNPIRFCTACGTALYQTTSTQITKSSRSFSTKYILIITIALVVITATVYLVLNNKKDNKPSAVDAAASMYIPGKYPQATEKLLTPDDLIPMNLQELRIMRNEIFARHGYIFKSQEMIRYFNNQSWYQPRYNEVAGMFSDTEKKNIELIKVYEKLSTEYDEDF